MKAFLKHFLTRHYQIVMNEAVVMLLSNVFDVGGGGHTVLMTQ